MNPALATAQAQSNVSTPKQGGLDPQLVEQIKSQMADIIEPAAIGWWPLAWGWWVLIAAVSIVITISVVLGIKHHLANRYRRSAIKTLKHYAQQNQNAQQQAQSLMQLSKQVALHAYPSHRHAIAKAHGQDWLNWLNSTTKAPLFNTTQAQQWQQALYTSQSQNQSAIPTLNTLLQQWVKQHISAHTLNKQNAKKQETKAPQKTSSKSHKGSLNV